MLKDGHNSSGKHITDECMTGQRASQEVWLVGVKCTLNARKRELTKHQRGTTAGEAAIITRQSCQRQSLGLLHIRWAVKRDEHQRITNTNQIYLNYTGSLE